ncbi:MAG: type IV pilin protein [Betaproteobacteria bacterium]|nr:type IV pilin protein [Betaproteobacteria bacterium]
MEISQALERFHTEKLTYAGFAVPSMQCISSLAGHYTFSLGDQAARTYTLSAVPEGAQSSNDPASCGTLTINQAGQKGAGGDASVCWR